MFIIFLFCYSFCNITIINTYQFFTNTENFILQNIFM